MWSPSRTYRRSVHREPHCAFSSTQSFLDKQWEIQVDFHSGKGVYLHVLIYGDGEILKSIDCFDYLHMS